MIINNVDYKGVCSIDCDFAYSNLCFNKKYFKTQEDAEEYAEFGNITRTERLEFPSWEELFKQDRLLDCYTQEFAIVKSLSVIGIVLFGVDFTNEIIEVSIGNDKLFIEPLTRENYNEVRRLCVKLFKGEEI